MKYVGAKSTNIKPELDTTYLGSGRLLPKDRHDNRHTVNKVIIGNFATRDELMEFERNFIIQNNCCKDTQWYNQRVKTYDLHGALGHNNSKSTLASITQGLTMTKRYGNGFRTPAQIDGAKRMAVTNTGTKNPFKGHLGTSNSGFVPWYYITPMGDYVEVLDKTKRELAKELGFTERQLTNGFHHTNIHKKARTLPRKGWTFGNLPKPTETVIV